MELEASDEVLNVSGPPVAKPDLNMEVAYRRR